MDTPVWTSIWEKTQELASDLLNEAPIQATTSMRHKIQEASGIDDALWDKAGLDMFVDFLQKENVSSVDEYLSLFFSRFKNFVLESQWKEIFPWFKESFFPKYSHLRSLKYHYRSWDEPRDIEQWLAYIPFDANIRSFLSSEGVSDIEAYSALIFTIISPSDYSNSRLDYYKRLIHALLSVYPALGELKAFIAWWKDPMSSFDLCVLFADHTRNSGLEMTKEEKDIIVSMAKNIEHNIGHSFGPLISRFESLYTVEGAGDDAYDQWRNVLTYPKLFQTFRLFNEISQLEAIKNKTLSIWNVREIIDIYCRTQGGISPNIVDWIIENLLPLIGSNSTSTKLIIDRLSAYEEQSYFPRNRGTYFFESPRKALLDIITTPIANSFDINKSLHTIKQIPTLDIDNHVQNRKDALFVSDRSTDGFIDFIHRQDPLIHEFISTMICYYDAKTLYDSSTGDREQLENDMYDLENELSKMHRKNQYLSRVRYSSLISLLFDNNWSNSEQRSIQNIEIFRRLERNTRSVSKAPSDTIDPKLLLLIKKSELDATNFHGAVSIVKHLNEKLVSYMASNKVGIDINELVCINWIDGKLMDFVNDPKLNNMSFFKSTTFFEIFKFRWITNSTNFSENSFTQIKQKIQDSNSSSDIKRIIRDVLYENVYDLAVKYKKRWMADTDVLWSWNLTRAFLDLLDTPNPYNEHYWERFNDTHKDDDGMI